MAVPRILLHNFGQYFIIWCVYAIIIVLETSKVIKKILKYLKTRSDLVEKIHTANTNNIIMGGRVFGEHYTTMKTIGITITILFYCYCVYIPIPKYQ